MLPDNIKRLFRIPGTPVNYLQSGSLILDYILSGGKGYPLGGFIEMAGKPDAGKTSLGLLAIAYAQKLKGQGVIINTERELDAGYMQSLGVDPARLRVYQPQWVEKKKKKEIVKEWEELYLELVCQIIEAEVDNYCEENQKAPLVIMWDSGGNTHAKDEVKISLDKKNESRMALRAAKLTEWLRQGIVSKLNNQNILVIVINHLKDSFQKSWYGESAESPLGAIMKFVCLSRNHLVKAGTIGEPPEAIRIRVENKSSKFAKAYRKAKLVYYPGRGVDNIVSVVYHLQDEEILKFDGNGRTDWDGSKLYASQLIERAKNDSGTWEELQSILGESW